MGNLGKRVRLIHELAQCVRAEEGIDDRRNRFGVDKVDRSEHLVVAHIHALLYGAAHSCQTHAELVVKLFAYRTDTAAQVVYVINITLGIDEFDQILDNLYDVFACKHFDIHRCGET